MQKYRVSAGPPQRTARRNAVAPRHDVRRDPERWQQRRHHREEGEHDQPQPQRQPQRLAEQRADFALAAGAVQLRYRGGERDQGADRDQHRQPQQRRADGHRGQGRGGVVAGNDVVDEGDQTGGHMPEHKRQGEQTGGADFLAEARRGGCSRHKVLDANYGCARRAQAPGCGRSSYARSARIPMTWRECWVPAGPGITRCDRVTNRKGDGGD